VKLAHRLLLQSLAIVAVMVISVVLIIDNQLHNNITERTTHDLAGEARLLALQWKPGVNADSLADNAGAATGHRITLIDGAGHVVGDSDFDGAALLRLENHSSRPEVASALASGMGSSKRMSPSTGEEQLYVAIKSSQGVVRLSVTTKAIARVFAGARQGVIVAGVMSFLLATILAALFARAVSKPITDLRDIARSIAAGGPATQSVSSAPGEIRELADAINWLARELQAKLNALEAEQTRLKRLENVRRDFVANVSHELRTPLTVVSGFAETLKDPDIPTERRTEFAQTILSNAQRMQRIVDELLDLTRIESGNWQPRQQPVDVGEVAREVFARASSAAQAKRVCLTTRIAQGATIVWADRTALEQILFNLVENAIRHTTDGSVSVEASDGDGATTLKVVDAGGGIAEEHLPRIFERFYRVEPGRSRDTGGTGLGLSIVKHLAEAHGGTVCATSVVGQGTSIIVRLPNKGPAQPVTTSLQRE